MSELEERDTYIIHRDHSQELATFASPESWHRFILQSMPNPEDNGSNSFGKLHTTRTTEFPSLKRSSGIWQASSYGKVVIIGLINTRVWPENESFNDRGIQPTPKRWKGNCENGTAFSLPACNKKLIRARVFNKRIIAAGRPIANYDYDSARAFKGHRTHTSFTIAGPPMPGVSHFGYARGIAQGVAPAAHVAMYKVVSAMDLV
ncbi:hypothetical protein CDL15_Pgr006742 [Punica granatum]|uniref:Uncharacterized protein n=1 Tax=Punica granatum TaxID=22663 RepID=A0A218X8K7_PUNGR|nr:hypothetical protein CDL15_Pgr006742 [Punica granatum]